MLTDRPSDLALNFVGPFTFTKGDNSVFESAYARSAGVYLWTVRQRRDSSHLIHYVGETTNLAKRHREHLIHILGLNYGIFCPERAQNGGCELLWEGLWRDKTHLGTPRQLAAYEELHTEVVRYISIISIFFAELETENAMRRHVEGCIGWNLRTNHPEQKTLYPDDNHIGRMAARNHGKLLVTANEVIRGLDSEIPY
jgi:hypothetical protein